MISPVWGGVDYPVTQAWGCTTLNVEPWWGQAQCHWHCGVDIGTPSGTPLYAARAGTVMTVAYGLLGIQPATGLRDWYVHIDSDISFKLSKLNHRTQLPAVAAVDIFQPRTVRSNCSDGLRLVRTKFPFCNR